MEIINIIAWHIRRTAMFRSAMQKVLGCGLVWVTAAYSANLGYLTANSDATVVGSITSRVEGPTQVSFTLVVGRVLIGSLSEGLSLSVVHPWAGSFRGADRTIPETLVGIWFVRRSSPGHWDVLPARPSAGVRVMTGLFLPATASLPSSGAYAYGPGTPPLDAVCYETASGVQSTGGDPEMLRDAYSGMNSAVVQSVLSGYLASTNAAFQAVGLAGMLERQSSGAVQQLAQMWPSVSSDPHGSDVLSALRDSWRDPSGVTQLASLISTRSPGDQLRAVATRALAAIHTKEALPFLAGLLGSTNPDDQIQAILGLSSFANGCPMQTRANTSSLAYLICDGPSAYKTPETVANFGFRPGQPGQEEGLVSFWSAWWMAHFELH
jgi:hypothetical protein